MARVYNTMFPVNLGSSRQALGEAIEEVSNGNLTLVDASDTAATLRFLDGPVFIRFEKSGSTEYCYVGDYINGSFRSISSASQSFYSTIRIHYGQIDEALYYVALTGDTFTASSMFGFTFCRYSVQGEAYTGVHLASSSGTRGISFFGAARSTVALYNFSESRGYRGSGALFKFQDRNSAVDATGEALLLPVAGYIRPSTSDSIAGAITWRGHAGQHLYEADTPSDLLDPRSNYIVDGVSYKACGNQLYLFL